MSGYFGIPLRNGLPLGLGTVISLRSGASWTPLTLFLAGEQGGWYDPSDLTTMFQDSAGTTPVTGVEQPVGLWLDKRLGALSALGPELVVNGDFATDTAWSKGTGWTISGGSANANTPSATSLTQNLAVSAGKAYRIQFTLTIASGNISVFLGGNSVRANAPAGTYSLIVVAGSANTAIAFDALNAMVGTVDNVSVREVPGNHLIQPTSASRPTYSKRYNQAVSTEDLTTASWTASGLLSRTLTGSATLPNGRVVPLTRCVENTANAAHRVQNTGNYTLTSGQEYVVSAVVKKGSRTWHYLRFDDASSSFLWFNADTGATGTVSAGLTSPSVVSLGDGAWLVSARRVTNAAAVQVLIGYGTADNSATFTGDGASFFDAGGVDLRRTIHTTMGMPAYQRVTTATDYDETGFLPRLRFDGADDSMYSAASIDFSASDHMTVLSGIAKLSDLNLGLLAEFSPNFNSNNGSFYIAAPELTGASGNFSANLRGSGAPTASVITSGTDVAPVTRVLSVLSEIDPSLRTMRVNSVQTAQSLQSQGTGTFGNHTLYIGRRNNATLPFNGDIFQLIVRGALTSGADLTSAEQYVAQRTGVTL